MPPSSENPAGVRDLAAALTLAPQPQHGLRALDDALARDIGHRLFTVLVYDWSGNATRRHYSSLPRAYPVGGAKPIRRDSAYFAQVVVAGRPWICRNAADIRATFFDHDTILSLGCEAAVNVPVRWNGETLGSLNLLHGAGWYVPGMLPALGAYAAMAIPLLLQILQDPALRFPNPEKGE